MNDVRALLCETVPQDLQTPSSWPDAGADLARGKALLAKRRRRFGLAGGAGVLAAGAACGLVLAGPNGTIAPAGHGSSSAGSSSAGSSSARIAVALVAYQGKQPEGYTLKTIPQGWEVATADNSTLVLHKIGSPKGGDYTDKILIAGDLNPFPTSGDQTVEVNGHKGLYFGHRDAGHSVTLIFQTDQRRTVHTEPGKISTTHPKLATTTLNVDVQLPNTLYWNVTTMVKFASGITVADGAGGGVG